jgi:hypothetical protein
MAEGDDPNRGKALVDELRSLSMQAACDFLSIVHRVNQLRDDADGSVLAMGEGSGVSTSPRPQPGELIYQLVKAQLAATSHLLKLGQQHAGLWLDRAQRTGASSIPPEQRVPTRLACDRRSDEPPAWTVYVYNAAHRARRIELRPRHGWRDEGGAEVEPCLVRADAAEVTARCERLVTLTHDWTAPLKVPGRYVGEVELVLEGRVVGAIELTLRRS